MWVCKLQKNIHLTENVIQAFGRKQTAFLVVFPNSFPFIVGLIFYLEDGPDVHK